ncbi:transcription factor HBP-1bc38-like protein isoform X2 [Cinnamomum micranthum f. kanehirae]|uniref:Transcription factor HBP-1bc38-like protein isoform X2 n=1 Tax=Cinnamomum micranthum f. kanehirae TaxID=337451 RepID=A0A3S3MFV4_9MAGN|nr:transcription factor HBP-1bc38-like protein isoform X2 [Cinnamomum micranthum f. kanehirae]
METKEKENQTPHQISSGMMQSQSANFENFLSKGPGDYELGELEQALILYLEGQDHSSVDQPKQSLGIQSPTLNIFPSQPILAEPTTKCGVSLVYSTTGACSRPPEASMEVANPRKGPPTVPQPGKEVNLGLKQREGNRKGPTSSSEHEGPKTPDAKVNHFTLLEGLHRIEKQLGKAGSGKRPAYVQQLESSRMKLDQLEQELQRARSQGVVFGSGGGGALLGDQSIPTSAASLSSGISLILNCTKAAIFDMEYRRWLDEHHRLMSELRAAVQEDLPENDLSLFVHNCLVHYDEMMSLKSMAVKSDVFHLISGVWKTPAERCFMWMGGFRPSELIKVPLAHIEPLTEPQIVGICSLQQSTQEAEDALSQGLEALHQSLSETIASDALSCPPDNVAHYMGQMAIALNKLSTLQGFVEQADNLRQQTFHRLHQILNAHQAARCFLAIADYFHRLRALSCLWLARPRQEQQC